MPARPGSRAARRKTRWVSGERYRAIHFDNVRVPGSQRLGKEGEGFPIAMRTLDRTRPSIGAIATGIAQRGPDESVKYAAERKAFGFPIAGFQAVQFMLADMAKDIEAARLLTLQSAWMIDRGMRASKNSSIAKCFATDMAMRVATDAVQIFGGNGYTKEYPVEKRRDAADADLRGTNQIQRRSSPATSKLRRAAHPRWRRCCSLAVAGHSRSRLASGARHAFSARSGGPGGSSSGAVLLARCGDTACSRVWRSGVARASRLAVTWAYPGGRWRRSCHIGRV